VYKILKNIDKGRRGSGGEERAKKFAADGDDYKYQFFGEKIGDTISCRLG